MILRLSGIVEKLLRPGFSCSKRKKPSWPEQLMPWPLGQSQIDKPYSTLRALNFFSSGEEQWQHWVIYGIAVTKKTDTNTGVNTWIPRKRPEGPCLTKKNKMSEDHLSHRT